MAEKTYIADKETLDAVKQDTGNILEQFPISAGVDWVQTTPKTNSPTSEHLTFEQVEINGSGFL
ncbi:hypothetical protein BTR22_18690, partial [Alkalihalophilus pseudofirmus]